MPNQIENIKSKGKEAIVQMAIKLIEEKQPKLPLIPEDYEIRVWANSKEINVKFRRLIRYIREDGYYEYDLSVDVLNKKIYPFDDGFYTAKFFLPTKEEKEVIQYLKESLNLPCQGMENSISEDAEFYFVHCTSKTAFSIHHINKKTGQPLAPLEGTYAVMPEPSYPDPLGSGERRALPADKEEQDPLIEIKK